ncbi:hypothetical protein FBEOM_10084 [Fusarium beomiforme]|uniref:Uncharacterized protein n=1 Tax=Fusarium beomiforme TaxID=44412 RepID=A0A9P5DV93_9HYPO|nr:hypothetical protein FBEOM_10084 [Fusarium beomiforme]
MHRFLLFRADTNWYGAFNRLMRDNPLPVEFCAKADNLDTICLFMKDVREALIKESSTGRKVRTLAFSKQPAPVESDKGKHKGKEFVEMNPPAAPNNMLIGVANVLDPRYSNRIAEATSVAVALPVMGWGVNGACLAAGIGLGTLTGLDVSITVPVWIGNAMPTMPYTASVTVIAIHRTLCEGPPAILGSRDLLTTDER